MNALEGRQRIISRKQVMLALNEIAAAGDPSNADTRLAVLERLKQALAQGRQEIGRRLREGHESGDKVAMATAHLIDQLIRVLYDYTVTHVYAATNPTAGEKLSIVAVGGYGRGEMAPHSDVDLLFLHPYKETPWSESVVEYILYILWDLGLKVGHATRSVSDSLRRAKDDTTIQTALLEARFIWGDQVLFTELQSRYAQEIKENGGPAFLEQKLEERDQRHKRFGDTRYVVEPNLKEGKGGLRDLHTLSWIVKFLYGVDEVGELVGRGVLTADESRRFKKAERFLWTVRCHLHDLTDRAEERVTFDQQSELARRLNYTDHAGSSGVERFMKHYFLVAKDVGDLTRVICTALEEQHRRRLLPRLPRFGLRSRKLDGFRAEGGRLNVAEADQFENEPIRMLQLFRTAQRRDLDIHPEALRLIRRNLKLINRKYRATPEANAIFVDILTAEQDPEVTLRRMNEAGVLGRFIPDFGRVVAQMQHDMYHHYTVDEHTIRAIGILWKIEQGMLAEDHPLSDKIVHKVLSRRVLYLAVLLHDIAKGRGGDHSVLGAEVAKKLGPRLGFEAAETETVEWLVRYHLAMSATAFKRDVADPKTIEDFTNLVQSPERLRLLLVLTVVDIRAVGPGVWNGWKGQLLRDLYYGAEEALSGGLISEGREARIADARRRLGQALADWPAADCDKHLERFTDSYWLSSDIDTLARQARMMRQADREERPLSVETRVDRFQSITDLTVYTADHAGLFARLTGALAVAGANIVRAHIDTTSDGMAVDRFSIQDASGAAVDQPSRIAKMSTTIEQTLSGMLNPNDVLASRRTPFPVRTRVFKVEPVVLIDNNASAAWTVIEVNGRDRPGLLHDLTWALFRLSLSIGTAKVSTYGARAVDVFYVKDSFGLKITHTTKLKRIEADLRHALLTADRRRKTRQDDRQVPDTAPRSAAGRG